MGEEVTCFTRNIHFFCLISLGFTGVIYRENVDLILISILFHFIFSSSELRSFVLLALNLYDMNVK